MSKRPSRNGFRNARRHVLRLPHFASQFATDWWSTRNWTLLALGLPAIMAGLAVWSFGLEYHRMSSGDWAQRYEAAGMTALGKGDLDAADVYFRRMTVLDESSPAASYGLALIAEQQQNLPRARKLLCQIAPETSEGYPEAHYWLAQDMIRQKVAVTPHALSVLEHHLQQALRGPGHRSETRMILSQLYAAGGRTEKAIHELEQVVSVQPELQLHLAQLYAQAGRTPEALRTAAKASEFFQARTQSEPGQPQHRLRWASSLVSQGHFDEAIRVLSAGLSLPDPQPFHQALATTYFCWLDASTKQGELDLTRQIEFLERVIEHDVDNERALAMLAELATRKEDSADQAMAVLKPLLARGTTPAVAHLVLGTRALAHGDADQGLMHLEQAQQCNPHIPEVLNNLAWGLMQQEQPDLERARQLAETALRLSPRPAIHDTLGTILIKLGRHREALTHLETALRALPPRAEIHEKLAVLYDQLGDTELGAEHRTCAQRLKTRSVEADLP